MFYVIGTNFVVMKSIFEYGDFRLYLRDYYDSRHAGSARFSWRAIAQRAHLKNPNFLRQVMLGDRNLGEKTMEPVGRAMGLSGVELEYWHRLVRFGQAKEGTQRERFRLELLQMRGSICPIEISSGFSEYYGHWFIPAVRELITLFDFGDDYALLAKSLLPAISEDDARLAVQILSRFHFIEKNADGVWVQTERALRSGSPRQGAALIKYHCDMLDMAARAVRKWKKDRRYVVGMTAGGSRTCFRMILAEAEKFKSRVAALVHNDTQSDTVMQIALQIFPIGASPSSGFNVGNETGK